MNRKAWIGIALVGAGVIFLAVWGREGGKTRDGTPGAAIEAGPRSLNRQSVLSARPFDPVPEPAAALALIEEGIGLEKKGQREEALAAYRKAIEKDTAYAMEHLIMLVGAENRPLLEEAAAEFQDALDLHVDTARSHHDLAQAIGAGRLDRAAALYRQANEAHPPYAQALQVLWTALEKRGMFDRAAQSVRLHQSMAPNSPELHRTLAALYWTQGAYAKAWEEVHRCQEKGGALDAGFLRALREKMAEPDRKTP